MNSRLVLKTALFGIVSLAVSLVLQMLNNALILGDPGQPDISFLLTIGIILLLTKVGLVVAYQTLGTRLPIRSPRWKALAFIGLAWASAYAPQVLGLAGADSPQVASVFSLPVFLVDSLVYLIDGILLGAFFPDEPAWQPVPGEISVLVKSGLLNAVVFPLSIFATERIIGSVYPPFITANALRIPAENQVSFYLVFYGCLTITGFLFPVFYRLTELQSPQANSPFHFAAIFSGCLWIPVVMAMIAFDAAVLPTFLFAAASSACILLSSLISAKRLARSHPIAHAPNRGLSRSKPTRA